MGVENAASKDGLPHRQEKADVTLITVLVLVSVWSFSKALITD